MKNILSALLLYVLLFISSSCQNISAPARNAPPPVLSNIEEIIIDQGDRIMAGKYQLAQVQTLEDKAYYFGYNKNAHQLEVYNLDQREVHTIIPLEKMGPDGIFQVQSFYVHDWNTIFLLDLRKIAVINREGEVTKSIKVNSKDSAISGIDFDQLAFYNVPNNLSPMYYDASADLLYLPTKSMGFSRLENDYYEQPLAGRLHLGTLTFEPFPISFPETYISGRFAMDKPCLSFQQDRIIYNFPASSAVYSYYYGSGKVQKVDIPSGYSKNEAIVVKVSELGDEFKMMESISLSPSFYRVMPDPEKKRFYRFHLADYKGDDYREKQGIRGTLYLTIMDEGFNKITELDMTGYSLNWGSVATSRGLLLIPINQYLEEGKFKFAYLTLDD